MSHDVIIETKPPGGGNLVAVESTVTSQIRWSPSHELTPAQERRRTEKAAQKLAEIEALLTAPANVTE